MPSSTPDPRRDTRLARRNVALALVHLAVAVGFMAAFFWVQAHR